MNVKRKSKSAKKTLNLLLILLMVLTLIFPAGVPAEPLTPPEIVKTGDPAKLTYREGEVFDLTGFSANVVTTSSAITVSGKDISVDKPGPLTTEDQEIIITVAPEDLTPVEYNYSITVNQAGAEASGAGENAALFPVGLLADGAGPTYAVTTGSAITGGKLTLSVEAGTLAAVTTGSAVTVKVEPDTGKRLVPGSLDYTADGGSTSTKITDKVKDKDNEYSFLMPAANVTVTAEFEPIPTGPATAATISFTSEVKSAAPPVGPAQTITAKVGDSVTVKAAVTAVGGVAYGFTAGFEYSTANLQFIADEWDADNPTIPASSIIVENGTIRVSRDSDGTTPFFTPDVTKVITFKFKVTNMASASGAKVNCGWEWGANRMSLFIDPDIRAANLKKDSTGLFLVRNETPADIVNKTVIAPVTNLGTPNTSIYTESGVTLGLTAVDALNKKAGETAVLKLTLGSEADVYGFGIGLKYNNSQLELDTSSWAVDNPDIQLPAEVPINAMNYIRVIQESEGSKKVINAGGTRDIILKFKLTNTMPSGVKVEFDTTFPHVLFTNETVQAGGGTGLFAGTDTAAWKGKILAAEAAGKVSVANPNPNRVTITQSYSTSVSLSSAGEGTPDDPRVYVGADPRPVTLTAKIAAPADKAVYGLTSGIVYPGAYLVLDQALTADANKGFTVGFGSVVVSRTTTTQQIYVESNGTASIISPGGTLDLKLVFKPTMVGSGKHTVTFGDYNVTGNRVVLFTHSSVRAVADGEGLTTVNFVVANIQEEEKAGNVVIASPAAGSITTTKRLSLALDSNGYYTLATLADLQAFADAVNNGVSDLANPSGPKMEMNRIKGNITANLDLPADFNGIGTEAYPFRGELKSSGGKKITVNLDRTVVFGDSPVIGGVVNYLGRGGIISGLTADGTIRVSGTGGSVSIGGIVGKSDGGAISNVKGEVGIAVTGISGNVGGIAGTVNKAQVTNSLFPYALDSCHNTGAVNGGTNTGGVVGVFNGLAGDTSTAGTISQSTNSGAISGGVNVGGIAGSSTGGVVEASGNGGVGPYNVDPARSYLRDGGGNISGRGAVGGVVGLTKDTAIANCYNTGAISGGIQLGGIVGSALGAAAITESWNSAEGTVTGSDAQAAAGGIIGVIGSEAVQAEYNFNLGMVSAGGADAYVGGITGRSDVTPVRYKGNYYLMTVAAGDGLDEVSLAKGNNNAIGSSMERFLLNGRGASAPGRYSYLSDEPVRDADGTYLLWTTDDLFWFANTVNTNKIGEEFNKINARLMSNLDLSDEKFYGIGAGAAETRYAGKFDGNGKTVTVKLSGDNRIGFFNYAAGAEIRNLTIDGSVTGQSGAAGVVYQMSGGTIENCHNKAAISSPKGSVAGIVVLASDITIKDCFNSGTIQNDNSTGADVGGIAGQLSGNSSVEGCTNEGSLKGGNRVGGIAGSASVTASSNGATEVRITKCSNTGTITSDVQPSTNTNNSNAAGGIIGYVSAGNTTEHMGRITIENVSNSGDVSGTTNSLGGIMGRSGGSYTLYLTIAKATNSGNISSTYDGTEISGGMYGGKISAGGIVGEYSPASTGAPDSTVKDNLNTGNISANTKNGPRNISSLIGSSLNPIDEKANNKTTVLVGNDKNNPDLTYVGPTPPGIPGDSGGDTSDGDTSGGSGGDSGDSTPGGGSSGKSTPADSTPVSSTPADSTPSDNSPVILSPVNTASPAAATPTPSNPNLSAAALLQTAAAEESVQTPPSEQRNDPATNETEDPSSTEPSNVAEPVAKPATIFEVVIETIQNNPLIIRAVLVVAVILAGLGGYRRYRRIKGK